MRVPTILIKAAAFGLGSAKGLTIMETLTLPLRDAKCALALGYFTLFAVVIALMKVTNIPCNPRTTTLNAYIKAYPRTLSSTTSPPPLDEC